EDLRAGPPKPVGIEPFEPGDLAVLAGDQLRPVEARRPDVPAIAGGIFESVGEGAGIDHHLLGYAAADHAGAAHAVFFGHADARAGPGRDASRPHTARSATDDEEVEVELHTVSHCRRRMDCAA